MDSRVVYSDSLLEITHKDILFRLYYFPFGSKRVNFSEIDFIEEVEPTLKSGKWRIWGTGDFRTWFPYDGNRPGRDRIFIITQRNKRIRIGFTAEDTKRVGEILRDKRLLRVE